MNYLHLDPKLTNKDTWKKNVAPYLTSSAFLVINILEFTYGRQWFLNLSIGLALKCIIQAGQLASCLLPETPAVSLLAAILSHSLISIGQKNGFL